MSYVPEGRYCALKRAGAGNSSWDTLWMSDTPFKRQTNYDIGREASGDVLIVGLGLGMVAAALCRKPEVRSVTVLEIEPEVIALVSPHIRHRKLRVLLADGFRPPLRGRAFDTIYIDIWPNICSDNWETMKPLLAAYRKLQRPGGSTTAWMKEYVQTEHRKAEAEASTWL